MCCRSTYFRANRMVTQSVGKVLPDLSHHAVALHQDGTVYTFTPAVCFDAATWSAGLRLLQCTGACHIVEQIKSSLAAIASHSWLHMS